MPGVNFEETFSPVLKPITLRLVIAIVVMLSWPPKQLDVKNAFLHGHLKETVYMDQPPGFIDTQHPDFVCHLNKSIYGLKQALRAWFDRFILHILRMGFQCSRADSTMFILHSPRSIIILLLYVDGIVITACETNLLQAVITHLSMEFAIKDLGILHYFLGIEIHYFSGGVSLSQSKYAHDILIHA